MHRNQSPTLTVVYLTVALGGVLLTIVGGSAPLALILGAAIALCASTLALSTQRRPSTFRDTNLTAQWWKFLIAGPALVAAVIVAAGLGVEAWFLGLAVVLMAIGLVATGLILGLAHLASRRSASPA